jgi:hypothetical protein
MGKTRKDTQQDSEKLNQKQIRQRPSRADVRRRLRQITHLDYDELDDFEDDLPSFEKL